jgi:hypothetical protein
MGHRQHALPRVIVNLTTARRFASPPRWARSLRPRWGWSDYYAFLFLQQLLDNCVPGSRRCESVHDEDTQFAEFRLDLNSEEEKMLLEDKNAVIYSKCSQSA